MHRIQHAITDLSQSFFHNLYLSERAFLIGNHGYSTDSSLKWLYAVGERGYDNVYKSEERQKLEIEAEELTRKFRGDMLRRVSLAMKDHIDEQTRPQ